MISAWQDSIVETRVLKQQVKRNNERFPEDFMFQLTKAEWMELITICDKLKNIKYSPVTPPAFTGIYIFNVESIEEAQELTNSDPAIQAGSLVMELKEWYGTADLMAVNDIHKSISRQRITEEE